MDEGEREMRKPMGRPRIYHEPRRHFTVTLPDDLIAVIDEITWNRRERKTTYIEHILRQWPEIAARLTPPEQEERGDGDDTL